MSPNAVRQLPPIYVDGPHVHVLLRKGDFDAAFAECAIDGHVQIVNHTMRAVLQIRQKASQDKIQGAIAEGPRT